MRLNNFAAIDKFVEEWNANIENTSSVGHNFMSDWTDEEKKRLNGLARHNDIVKNGPVFKAD